MRCSVPPEPIFSVAFPISLRDFLLLDVITATLLVFLGNQLGVGSQLQTAVIVVLGIRIFTNVSSIRRFIFKG